MSIEARGRVRAFHRVAFVVLLALYAALAVAAALRDASVADEHPHIASGWLFWESGRFSGGLDNPPLGQLGVAAPYRIFGLDYRFPDDTHLFWARVPVIAFLVILAVLVARWASAWGGAALGLVALGFMVLEPNLVAHGHLATLDLPLALFWWAALWQWRAVLRAQAAGSVTPIHALAVFFLAVTLAAFNKFTGLLLLPFCALVAIFALDRRGALRACAWLTAVALAGVLASHVAYGFGPVRGGLPAELVDAVAGKWTHRDEGHFAYLMGRRSVEGFPEYYLVTLLVKTPLALLGLAILGTVVGWRRLSPIDRALLVVPAVALVVVFSIIRVNIGVRHILPVYPALVLAAALGARFLWQRLATRVVLVVVCATWAVGVARVVPQQLAYFNVIAGGASGGHRWLLDSNLDWGQDDRRLEEFLAAAAQSGETWHVNPDGGEARTGRCVVNANRLHNLLLRDTSAYAWLRGLDPVGDAGYAWRRYALEIDDFAARATRRPNDVDSQIAHAEALAFEGRWDAAAARYRDAQQRFTARPRLFRSAVESALRLERPDAAEHWLRLGLEKHPQDVGLHALRARLDLEHVVRTAPDSDDAARARASLGLWWAEQGDIERALPLLRAAASARPRDVEIVRALGVAEARRGRFADAVAVFERTPVAAALRAEAAACRALARTESALADTQGAPSGARPTRGAWMELATTHFADGRYDRAAAALVEILRDDAADGEALALLSEMHVRTKLRIVEGTIAPRSLRHDPRTSREAR